MAEGQDKTEASAEKAYAEAAEKVNAPASASAAKPEEAAPAKAVADDPIEPKKAAAKKTNASARKVPAKPAAAGKPKKSKAAPKKVARKKTEATPTISQLKDKIMATAKTNDFTKTFKTASEDFQARVKTAYDKGAAMTAEMTDFQKGNLEALVESGKILASGVQDWGRVALEDAKSAAETATDDVKKMAAIKSPTELFQLQGEIARRNFDAAIAQTSKNAEAMMKLTNEIFAPISTRASVAAEKISKAA